MVNVIYDGSWKGLLTVIFTSFEQKLKEVLITKETNFQTPLFGRELNVITEEDKARRVLTGLKTKISSKAIHDLYSCFLSEREGIENTILTFVRLAYSGQEGIEFAFGHQAVLQVSQVSKMVHREKHRMEAFIRFRLTQDNLYFASVEPDFDVLPLIVKHFKNRYADQKWVIYDIKRKYGVFYDLEKVEEIIFDFSNGNASSLPASSFCEDEFKYEQLWQDYFKNVNITERKNMQLHLRHVPKRYWKHLPEKVMNL